MLAQWIARTSQILPSALSLLDEIHETHKICGSHLQTSKTQMNLTNKSVLKEIVLESLLNESWDIEVVCERRILNFQKI